MAKYCDAIFINSRSKTPPGIKSFSFILSSSYLAFYFSELIIGGNDNAAYFLGFSIDGTF